MSANASSSKSTKQTAKNLVRIGEGISTRLLKMSSSIANGHQKTLMRMGGNLDGEVYSIRQILPPAIISQLVLSDYLVGGNAVPILTPSISLMDQVGTVAALFDQYRIVKVEYRFIPNNKVGSPEPVSSQLMPNFMTVIDYDDGNNPGTIAMLREYQSALFHDPHKEVVRVIKPRIAVAAYAGGGFSSYANQTSWIDIASTTVPHYGLKLGVTGGNLGQTQLSYWYLVTTIHVEFRHVR